MITSYKTSYKTLLFPLQIEYKWSIPLFFILKYWTLAPRLQHNGAHELGQPIPSSRPETSKAKTLMDIGTRRIFNEDHDLFRQSVRRFFQEEVVPHHKEWEKAGQVSREVWEKAGEQGLLGVMTPEECGGIGGDLLSAAITWEEQ